MEAERFRRLEALFGEVLDAAPEDREAWITDRCGADAVLAGELRALLAAEGDTTSDPAREVVLREVEETAAGMAGRRIGAYAIIETIGQGGMGTVYRAARTGADFEQQVALKLLRVGLRDAVSLERFRRERQVLARLSHPNIAGLVDGGTAADGTPWVAMELVQGTTLPQHADARALALRARVALFLSLCQAIAYAHRNLVVHRDLKPENVLVDDEGHPRVLDFGIAKLLDDEAEGTATLARAFTPTYASPEQILGLPVTPACDVYSLGVMLCELITGELPYRLDGARRTDWARQICELPPVRPRSQSNAVPPDLEAIILMALRKEPERRYATAGELAADLDRFLAARPVLARPDSAAYRLGKAIARHPLGTVMASVAALLLAAFVANTFQQSRVIAAERDRAVQEAAVAKATTDFLIDLFKTPDPREQDNAGMSAMDVLERGAAQIDGLEAEPLVRARLLHVMGLAFGNLGQFDPALELLNRALEIRRVEAGEDSAAVADSHNRIGNFLREAGRYREAEAHLLAALRWRVAFGEGDSQNLADSYNNVGLLQRDLARYEQAAENLTRAMEMHRRLSGQNSLVAVAQHNLALVRLAQARPDEAAELARAAMRIKETAGLRERSTYANTRSLLARALLHQGRLDEALFEGREALDLRQHLLPSDHPHIAAGLGTVADVEAAMGLLDQALARYEEAVSLAAAAYGEDAWRTYDYRSRRARILEGLGDLAAAERAYRATLAAAEASFETDSLILAGARADLARVLLNRGRSAEAEHLADAVLAARSASLEADHPDVLRARTLIALARSEAPPPALEARPEKTLLDQLYRRLLAGAGTRGDPSAAAVTAIPGT